jgi:SAM-dependent methyltransferase
VSRDVAAFFDRSAASYRQTAAGMAPYHRVTARRIEAVLAGRVLALGSLWAEASGELPGVELVVADVSLGMLAGCRGDGHRLAGCDALALAFRPATFDHLVLPLVLHHIAGRSSAEARRNALAALRQARTVLRPGGVLWISELCTSGPVYALQRCLASLTRRWLARVGEPLVLMHSAEFYRRALIGDAWREVTVWRIVAPDARPTDWVRPIIAAPSLRLPRFLYPLRPTLIRAVA